MKKQKTIREGSGHAQRAPTEMDEKYQLHRRSIRLPNFDYGGAGVYFVTICTYNRECLFGEVVKDEMVLNTNGCIAVREWLKTTELRPDFELGSFVVMPNHIHGIIIIRRGTLLRALEPPPAEAFGKPTSNSIPTVIRGFKATVTKQINEHRRSPREPVWQRNYHEHIIRDEVDWNRVHDYIEANPSRWAEDEDHP